MLPASLKPSPHFLPGIPLRRMGSHLAQRLPEEDSGVTATPAAAAWSSRRVWVSLEGRELGTLSSRLCPGSEGPVHPGHGWGESLRSAHRACPCQRRGRGLVCRGGRFLAAVTHPRHIMSGRPAPPRPLPRPRPAPCLPGPSGQAMPLWRAAGGHPHLLQTGTRLRTRLRHLLRCPWVHPGAQGSAVKEVPPHLQHREGVPALHRSPGTHHTCPSLLFPWYPLTLM